MEWLKDKSGKLSTKRVWGTIENTLGLLMAVCSGFDFYDIDSMLILTILGNGSVLLGLGTFEKK